MRRGWREQGGRVLKRRDPSSIVYVENRLCRHRLDPRAGESGAGDLDHRICRTPPKDLPQRGVDCEPLLNLLFVSLNTYHIAMRGLARSDSSCSG